MFEEIAGPAPDDEMSREEETSWILKQLAENACLLLYLISGTDLLKKINKEDIMRFLELRHLEKYDVSNLTKNILFSFQILDCTI